MSKVFKATKKPVTIDVIKLTKDYKSIKDCLEFMGQEVITDGVSGLVFHDYCDALMVHSDGLTINTLEGKMQALWGDYIIKGVKGEFYPCKPDIFKATYDFDESL